MTTSLYRANRLPCNQVGDLDPLYNDSLALYHHLASSPSSNDVELHLVPNATHAFERAGLEMPLSGPKSTPEMREWAENMKEVWGVVERRLRAAYEAGNV